MAYTHSQKHIQPAENFWIRNWSMASSKKVCLRLSLQSGKRYQPQNAVYLLCVNWSHSKVIKKRVTLNSPPTIDILYRTSNESMGILVENIQWEKMIQQTPTTKHMYRENEHMQVVFVPSSWIHITSQLINSPAKSTRQEIHRNRKCKHTMMKSKAAACVKCCGKNVAKEKSLFISGVVFFAFVSLSCVACSGYRR